jgi:hypothetical protein
MLPPGANFNQIFFGFCADIFFMRLMATALAKMHQKMMLDPCAVAYPMH